MLPIKLVCLQHYKKLDYELLGIQDKKKGILIYITYIKKFTYYLREIPFFHYEIQNCICHVQKYVSGDNILKLGFIRNIETVFMGHCGWLNNGPQRYLLPNPWNL